MFDWLVFAGMICLSALFVILTLFVREIFLAIERRHRHNIMAKRLGLRK